MSLSDVPAALKRVSPRVWVRLGFLSVLVLSCWRLWRYYQWALGVGASVSRPEATAGFVPVGALMSISAWLKSGTFDPIMPAAVVIVLAATTVSILFKRGFCGYVCPVGTVNSAVAWVGRLFSGGRPRRINRWLDASLRVPKYLIAGFFLLTVFRLPAEAGLRFQQLPYYATADLKILYGLLHPAVGYLAFFGFVAVTTLAIGSNTWCRYMCPLGAVYGGVSAASVGTVKRDAEACIDCKACDHACNSRIEVSEATRAIRDPECDGCLDCTRACKTPGALEARFGGAKIATLAWPLLIVTVWLLIVVVANGTGHWQQGLPDTTIAQYMREMKLTADW